MFQTKRVEKNKTHKLRYTSVACLVFHYLENRNGKEPSSSAHEIQLIVLKRYSKQFKLLSIKDYAQVTYELRTEIHSYPNVVLRILFNMNRILTR
jgi:hypothetical protein